MLSDAEIRDLLERARTIAVVGLSDRPERDSHGIAAFLLRQGYRVLPVNPNLRGPVLGEQPYASLRDIREHVDIVNVFRRPEYLAQIVDDAILRRLDGRLSGIGLVRGRHSQLPPKSSFRALPGGAPRRPWRGPGNDREGS